MHNLIEVVPVQSMITIIDMSILDPVIIQWQILVPSPAKVHGNFTLPVITALRIIDLMEGRVLVGHRHIRNEITLVAVTINLYRCNNSNSSSSNDDDDQPQLRRTIRMNRKD